MNTDSSVSETTEKLTRERNPPVVVHPDAITDQSMQTHNAAQGTFRTIFPDLFPLCLNDGFMAGPH